MRDSSNEEHTKNTGLSFIQFLILGCIASGTPYGTEYSVYAFGVGYTIIFIILLSIFFSLPVALISTELIALMPTNHGQIAWTYRAFDNINFKIFGSSLSDFIGFLNAVNLLLYYLFAIPVGVIIFAQYLETAIGPISSGYLYLIELAVIICAFILNIFNINIVGNFVNWSICAAMTPFFIGFFWRLPDINVSQWLQPCEHYDYAFFFSQMAFMAAGYEAMGALGGELNFGPKKLMIAFTVSVAISAVLMIIPIMTAATITYEDCTSWYDGYFGVSYGEIWTPFYYAILIGALFSNFAFLVMSLAIAARVIWAMSQPFILLLEDGTMILHNSETQNYEFENITRIPLGILPKQCGTIWDKTGSPIFGVIFFSVCCVILCSFITYKMVMEFIFFMYMLTFIFVILSFLIMKHYEPNTPRWFEIPFGKIGAWILSLFSLCIMGFIFVIMVYSMWIGLFVWLTFNLCSVVYYFTLKKLFDKRNVYIPIK